MNESDTHAEIARLQSSLAEPKATDFAILHEEVEPGGWSYNGEADPAHPDLVTEVYAALEQADRDLIEGENAPPVARGILRQIAARLTTTDTGGLGGEVREAMNSINSDVIGTPWPILALGAGVHYSR